MSPWLRQLHQSCNSRLDPKRRPSCEYRPGSYYDWPILPGNTRLIQYVAQAHDAPDSLTIVLFRFS